MTSCTQPAPMRSRTPCTRPPPHKAAPYPSFIHYTITQSVNLVSFFVAGLCRQLLRSPACSYGYMRYSSSDADVTATVINAAAGIETLDRSGRGACGAGGGALRGGCGGVDARTRACV